MNEFKEFLERHRQHYAAAAVVGIVALMLIMSSCSSDDVQELEFQLALKTAELEVAIADKHKLSRLHDESQKVIVAECKAQVNAVRAEKTYMEGMIKGLTEGKRVDNINP